MSNHQCMIYAGSTSGHLPGLAGLAREKLRSNWRCLYLHNPRMVEQMASHLARAGVAVAEEVARGSLVLSSDQGHFRDGNFDVDRMIGMIEDAVNQALGDGYQGLWATGDMAWEFGDEKNFGKLLEYEYKLECLFEQQPALSGVCQYHVDTLPADVVQWGLCTHQSVYVNEKLSRPNPYYAPANLLTYRGPIVPRTQLSEMLACPVQPLEGHLAEAAW